MFFKPKFKKIDKISYKGYEIPIYSNGDEKYVGYPQKEGVDVEENKIYRIEDIGELKTGIFLINKYGDDVDTTEFFPKSIGTIKIKNSKKMNELRLENIIKKYLKEEIEKINEKDDWRIKSRSQKLSSGKFKNIPTDFDGIVQKVVQELEGGYYHPNMLKDGRVKDQRYAGSGETMFGIDRKTGGSINTTSAGKQFWSIIDGQNAKNKWKWNYFGGPLQSQLMSLIPKMMKPLYDQYCKSYLSPKAIQIVNSTPPLMFHFVYGVWNGPGWFQKFAKKINLQVANGNLDPVYLTKSAVSHRINSGNSLIAQGGRKISNMVA
jgi:hypothetical protein